MPPNEIIDKLNNHSDLEAFYQEEPLRFEKLLQDAIDKYPESETLSVWAARISFSSSITTKSLTPVFSVIIVSLVAFLFAKLPTYFDIDDSWYTSRFVPLIVISTLIAYYLPRVDSGKLKRNLITGFAFSFFYLLLLPERPGSASITMALIHIPLGLTILLALSFMNEQWASVNARMRFIRYCGEVLIYTGLILIGGMVLTGVTLGLFGLIDVSIDQWYSEYVLIWGLVSAPLVATYLYDTVVGQESKIATVLSNVFAPLFFVTVSAYLLVALYQGKSLYSDRDFLITFNGLLLLIWAITVFSVAGKVKSARFSVSDVMNIALLSVTLIVNGAALSAILFRLAEFGFTPNRFVVTGANLLIFTHLLLLLRSYFGYFMKNPNVQSLESAIASYLPIYSGWSLFVAFLVPIMFNFN